jgi:membrane protein
VTDLLAGQFHDIASADNRSLGAAAVGGVLVALWSASAGVNHLMGAINAAYDLPMTRSYPERRGMAVVLTLGLLALASVALLALTVVPAWFDSWLGPGARQVVAWLRWPVLACLVIGALVVFYRIAPDRDDGAIRWAISGAGVGTVVWLVGSAGFSFYVSRVADYNEIYGALGGVVVVLIWLLLSAFAVVLGAEVNAELERRARPPGPTSDPTT